MNAEQKALLELARSAMLICPPDREILLKANWEILYLLIIDAKLHAIVYDVVCALEPDCAPPLEVMDKWKKRVLYGTLRQMKAHYTAAQIIKKFTERGIALIVFKGPVLADLYPSPDKRFSKDLDILVSDECFDQAQTILKEFCMQYNNVESKDCVSVWDIQDSLQIEMHTNLWEDYQGEQIERLKMMHLTEQKSLIHIESSIGSIVTMGHTEHLVYQMFHTIKHLLFQGIALRVFMDTALFINRYIEEIDVARFWACMDTLKYTRFCIDMFCVCERYFQMDNRIFLKEHHMPADSETFMKRIVTVCLRNIHDPVYNRASNAVFHTFLKENEVAEKSAGGSRMGHTSVVAKLVIPNGNFLPERYEYAKKHAILLPVAWIHRAIYKLLFERSESSGFDNVQKSLFIARQRTAMLQEYELIE